MCGIAGILDYSNFNSEDLLKSVSQMINTIKYRGPDEQDFFIYKNLALGHCRLKVIDLQSGKQPMSNEEQSIWIVFNGEIFNYIELRNELKNKHKFKTNSDTEVIIHLYEEYGTNCLKYLNGEFAFAIFDKNNDLLFIARDRPGIKPLYYFWDGNRFIFASEIKAILNLVPTVPNMDVILNDYEVFHCVWDEQTFFKNIYQVMPGNFILLKNRELKIQKYWEIIPNNYDYDLKEDEIIEKLKYLLIDSIKLRTRSDVPIGAYISGGIDSSIVSCISKPKQVFSVNFSKYGPEYNEHIYASMISKYINATHHFIYPTASNFKKLIKKVIWHMDQPCATMAQYPQFIMANKASKYVKVVLGGQGSDELWGGYIRYLLLHIERRLSAAMFNGEPFCPEGLYQFRFYEPLVRHIWKQDLFESPDKRYFRIVNRGTPKKQETVDKFLAIFNVFNHYINQMLYTDFKTSLMPLLQVEDRVNSAASIESRLPMLDHRLIEFAFSVPPELKLKNNRTKYLLRKAAYNIVPDPILKREDKIGFPVPLNLWFQNELKDYVLKLLKSLNKRGIEGYFTDIDQLPGGQFNRTLWSKVSLEIWFQVFVDKNYEKDCAN